MNWRLVLRQLRILCVKPLFFCAGSGKRMGGGDGRLQALARDMGVDLRGRDIDMAGQRLYAPEIGAAES